MPEKRAPGTLPTPDPVMADPVQTDATEDDLPPRIDLHETQAVRAVNWRIFAGGIFGVLVLCLSILHIPWGIYKLRQPAYVEVCQIALQQEYVMQLASSINLTYENDADALAAARVPSGNGSIPIHEVRIRWNGGYIDLKDHPSWDRLMAPLEFQDSSASLVIITGLKYCNMPEPWALWRKRPTPLVIPAARSEVQLAEAS